MKKLKTILQSKYIFITLLLFSLLFSIIVTKLFKHDIIYDNNTHFEGIISDYKIDGDKLTINLKTKEKLIGTYYIKSEEEKEYLINNILYGSSVIIDGETTTPFNNTIPNTFNYKDYLYNKKIYIIINISNIKINNNNISFFYKIKNIINNIINKRNNSEYIKAFILGNKSNISVEDYTDFKNLGISHLFAISGMHITLFSSVVLHLLCKFKRNKNIAIIISIIILFLYGLLCSFPSSIRRAFTLYFLLSINKMLKFDIKSINLLYLTIVINIIIDPYIIYDIGFLYSISTTFGLIISSKFLNKGNYFFKIFKVSLIAYIFSLPITINNNYMINLMSPVNNILLVPLVSFIIYPLSIFTFIIPFINPIFDLFINILLFISSVLLKINIFNIVIPKMNLYFVFLYYFILLLVFKNKKMLFLLIIIIIIIKYSIYFDHNSYLYFLDVGQGDSAIIINSYLKDVTMIDTGGVIKYNEENWKKKNNNYNLSNNTIIFLHSLGIKKINNLILSHGDYDHMGEAKYLVENFKIEKVVFNCGPYNDLEKELIKVLDKKHIKYYSCIKELNIDKNKLYFLQTKEYDNENDNSNVIYTELEGYKFMFMGDVSITTEKEILNNYNLPDIDVLKVGHHGSKTSSSEELIDKINPKYSIISVGKNNRYGHPNKEALDNLKDSKIYRTDQDGSIMFKIKNNKLKIEACSP